MFNDLSERVKATLCIVTSTLCIAGAVVLVHSYKGTWADLKQGVTAEAGPLLTFVHDNKKRQTEKAAGSSSDAKVVSEQKSETPRKLYAYITGAVNKPGMYEITDNTRIGHLVQLAGGLRRDADLNGLNMADHVSDGEHVDIKVAPGQASDNLLTAPLSVVMPLKP